MEMVCQMGRSEKEMREQTGEKLIESSTRSGLVFNFTDIQPCEGDFAAWIKARRLSTTFSMSESR